MKIGQNKERARESEIKKERKRRGNRKYGQAKFRHAKKGIYSLMMAIVVVIIFATLILTAFLHKGQSSALIGSFGLFTMILSVIGIIIGVRGFRERDKNYVTCKWGIGCNGFVLLSLVIMFIRGIV